MLNGRSKSSGAAEPVRIAPQPQRGVEGECDLCLARPPAVPPERCGLRDGLPLRVEQLALQTVGVEGQVPLARFGDVLQLQIDERLPCLAVAKRAALRDISRPRRPSTGSDQRPASQARVHCSSFTPRLRSFGPCLARYDVERQPLALRFDHEVVIVRPRHLLESDHPELGPEIRPPPWSAASPLQPRVCRGRPTCTSPASCCRGRSSTRH